MKLYLLSLIFLTGFFLSIHSQTVTTGSLFEEMINLKNLSEIPNPYYKMVQYSSYDHRSTLPGGPGWWDNSDGF